MKRKILLWVVVMLMSGIFAIPKTAFTRDERNYNGSQLQGRWYMNGDPNKPTEINADRRGLEARNENGHTSRLEVDRKGNIRALDWHGIRGDLRGNRIQWDNGTTWTRRPSDRGRR
jgi:hypothetical protein